MKTVLFLLFFLPVLGMAQSTPEKWYAGLGIGEFHYKTRWYYYRADGNPRHDNYPIHSINKLAVILNLGRRGLFTSGPFRWDADGQLQLGIVGKAKGEWLPNDETISGGGFAAGIVATLKAVYTLPAGHGPHIGVFGGLGPQVSMLHNNGKDAGTFASAAYYNYTEGWNEYLFMLQGRIGVDLAFSGFTLTPELHFGITGFSSTSWEPNERGVSMDSSPTLLGFSVTISRPLP